MDPSEERKRNPSNQKEEGLDKLFPDTIEEGKEMMNKDMATDRTEESQDFQQAKIEQPKLYDHTLDENIIQRISSKAFNGQLPY